MYKKIILPLLMMVIMGQQVYAERLSYEMVEALKKSNIKQMKKFFDDGVDLKTLYNHENHAVKIIIDHGDLEFLQSVLKSKADINSILKDETPLLYSIRQGQFEIARWLIDNGADVSWKDRQNKTPLYYAVRDKRNRIIHHLVNNGAFPEGNEGLETINITIDSGDLEVFKLLLKNAKNIDYSRAFVSAINSRNLEIITLLAAQIEDITSVRFDIGGQNLLTYTLVYSQDVDILHYFYRMGIPMQTDFTLTKLMYYCALGSYSDVKYILETDKKQTNKIVESPIQSYYPLYSPMGFAIQFGHLHIVKLLMKYGVKRGSLIRAVKLNQNEIAAYLLQNGADPNQREDRGRAGDWTPLTYAIRNDNDTLYTILVENGAYDIGGHGNQSDLFSLALTSNSTTIIRLLLRQDAGVHNINKQNALKTAVYSGKFEIVKLLLDEGANIKSFDDYGNGLLMLAWKTGEKEIFELLQQRGARLTEESKITLIAEAAENENYDEVKQLTQENIDLNKIGHPLTRYARIHKRPDMIIYYLEKGFDPNTVTPVLGTPFFIESEYAAIISENLEILKTLIKYKADINAVGHFGYNLLHYFVQHNFLEGAALIVDNNGEINRKNRQGETALMIAAAHDNYPAFELLINKGADVDIKRNKGKDIIDSLFGYQNIQMLQLLIDKGINLNEFTQYGNNLLHSGAKNGNLDLIRFLLDNNFDINSKNGVGNTALMLTVGRNNFQAFKLLAAHKNIDLNCKDINGLTVIMLALEQNNFRAVELLAAQKNIDLNCKDTDGRTAIMLAVQQNNVNTVKLLAAQKNIDLNCKDTDGRTALIYGVLIKEDYNKYSIIETIVTNGADTNITDRFEKTALDYARKNRDRDSIKLLKKYK